MGEETTLRLVQIPGSLCETYKCNSRQWKERIQRKHFFYFSNRARWKRKVISSFEFLNVLQDGDGRFRDRFQIYIEAILQWENLQSGVSFEFKNLEEKRGLEKDILHIQKSNRNTKMKHLEEKRYFALHIQRSNRNTKMKDLEEKRYFALHIQKSNRNIKMKDLKEKRGLEKDILHYIFKDLIGIQK